MANEYQSVPTVSMLLKIKKKVAQKIGDLKMEFENIVVGDELRFIFIKFASEKHFVNGILYDVKRDVFVKLSNFFPNFDSYTFYIYDRGVPNVICDFQKEYYYIIGRSNNGYYAVRSAGAPRIVSYYSEKDNVVKRAISYYAETKAGTIKASFLIQDENLNITSFYNDVEIEETISFGSKEFIYDADSADEPCVEYARDADFVVLNTNLGSMGNYVFYFPAFDTKLNMECSCFRYNVFNYDKDHYEVSVLCEQNDFDTNMYWLNITDKAYDVVRVKEEPQGGDGCRGNII